VLVTWLGLAGSYFTDQPIGFFVTTFAFAGYLLARGGRWLVRRRDALVPAPAPAGVAP
jgi:zinc/manganese transport system permease protein